MYLCNQGVSKADALKELLTESPIENLISARVGGSIARNLNDAFSDIDLFIVVEEERHIKRCISELVRRLGKYTVLDCYRRDDIWGTWVTGYFEHWGYVDVCAFFGQHTGLTHMSDKHSIVLTDQRKNLRRKIEQLVVFDEFSSDDLFSGFKAQAWLKIYKSGKELYRDQNLQFEKYFFEALENVVRTIRYSKRKIPVGNNWEQPFRGLHQDMPFLAIEVDALLYGRSCKNKNARDSNFQRLISCMDIFLNKELIEDNIYVELKFEYLKELLKKMSSI